MKVLLALLVSVGLWGQQMGSSPGSVYTPGGRFADLLSDLRASRVDDLVTIVVNDSASALASGTTVTSRKSSANHAITALAKPLSAAGALPNLLNTSGDQELNSSGQTSRQTTLATTLSARVVEVKPNGTLVVEGSKDIMVNSERQTITVRGMIRPVDLTTSNTVASTQVADLQVLVKGKGVVGDAIRRPNFLYRLLLGLLPF